MKQMLAMVFVLLGLAARVQAQGSVDAEQLYLGTYGGTICRLSSGSGAPTGGATCNVYVDYTNQEVYINRAGVWSLFPRSDAANVFTANQRINAKLGIGVAPNSSTMLYASTAADLNSLVLNENTDGTGISAAASFRASADTARAFLIAHGTGGTTTRYGTALGGYVELLASAGNGLIIGTSGVAKPVIFGANNVEAFRIGPTNQSLGTNSYVAQTTGWRILPIGSLDVRYLYSDEMRVKLFTAEVESVLAGSQRVTKSYGNISKTFTCPAPGDVLGSPLWVFDSPTYANAGVFQSADQVIIRSMSRTVFGPFTISDCVGVVTTYADGTGADEGMQSWAFTRNANPNGGSMTTSTTVAVNNLVQDMGVSGNGYVETVAFDGASNVNAPFSQTVTWVTAPVAANLTVRCREGNLKGITTVTEYGLLCGNFSGNAYIRFSDVNAEISGIPLNFFSSATKVISINPNGTSPYISLGNPAPTSYTAFDPGIFIQYSSAVSKARMYLFADANNFLKYDGSTLTWKAANTTLDASGNLTATNVTLTGNITATSGNVTGALAAGSISSTMLAADSVVSSKIAANTIVAADIAAGTITATEIAASTITAAKLNVTTLSSITADVGTLTAGTINGVTITGGNTTLDSNGISISTGTGGSNRVKWNDGAFIQETGSVLSLSSSTVQLSASTAVNWDGSTFTAQSAGKDLGTAGSRWGTYYGAQLDVSNYIYAPNISTDTGTAVVLSAAGYLRAQTSSMRYKDNVRPWTPGAASAILAATPILFDYKGGTAGVVGFSAEQLAAIDPVLVNLDRQGRPDSIRQDALLAYLFSVVKELQRDVVALRAR